MQRQRCKFRAKYAQPNQPIQFNSIRIIILKRNTSTHMDHVPYLFFYLTNVLKDSNPNCSAPPPPQNPNQFSNIFLTCLATFMLMGDPTFPLKLTRFEYGCCYFVNSLSWSTKKIYLVEMLLINLKKLKEVHFDWSTVSFQIRKNLFETGITLFCYFRSITN